MLAAACRIWLKILCIKTRQNLFVNTVHSFFKSEKAIELFLGTVRKDLFNSSSDLRPPLLGANPQLVNESWAELRTATAK